MKTTLFTLLSAFIFSFSYSQEMVKMKIERSFENKELNRILEFESININKFEFSSKAIIGKNYEINLLEFKDGKLVSTKSLFDSSELDYFKIKDKDFKFIILTKFIDDKKLKIALRFDRYGSATYYFDLLETKFGYTTKDFLNIKGNAEVELGKDFYLNAIISPTIHKDGSASYCEVVETKNPENIGVEYNIPHYFLIKMKFKD